MNDSEPGWLRRLVAAVWRHKRDVMISLGAALIGSAGQTVTPLVARHILDTVIGSPGARLWPWLVVLLVVAAATFGFAFLRRYHGGRVGLAVQYDLRNAMHDRLLELDRATLAQMPTGQLVSRASSDTTLVQGLLNFYPLMSGNLLMMVASLVVMFVLSPLLALVGLVVVPALSFVSYRMRTRVFPASWDAQQREGEVAGIVDEGVTGVRVVKAFAQEGRELERMAEAAQTLYGARMRTVRLQARFQPLLETIPTLAQAAVLALGGWLALRGNISIGTFLAFSTYVAQFASPARQLAGLLTVAQQARAGVERIFALLDLEPRIADRPDAVELDAIRGRVELRDVHFSHDGNELLRGVDLTVEPGERVAVVGASGSGKSTLTSLILRMHDPTGGAVLIDGHDLRDVRLASLRRRIGVAFEDSFCFSDTVAANIAYGRPDATRAEIEAAAKVAAAHEFITDLPNSYDTPVGERGLSLSGGQRQRIALARAVLTDPALLVLDDATSAVDANTEESIFTALREVLAGRTSLLVAHRVSTLRLADRVVVLEDGRIGDQGTHEELMGRNATYRSLLSGMDDDNVGDSIEGLAEVAQEVLQRDGVTASAWSAPTESVRHSVAAPNAPSLGPGMGGGRGGAGGWRTALAPTPELMARVKQLPPVRDTARIDLERETRQQRDFSLGALLREFRVPLLLGLLLVVIDSVAGLAGPVLVKTGVDQGVVKGASDVLFWSSAAFAAVALVDLVDQIAETFVTGRTAERIMLGLRLRIWAQLQRLSLDYYEREMAGRIMTRMTTDVDQFESLMENGLLNALVAMVTFVGVGAALLLLDWRLGLATLSVVVPLAVATVIFRRITTRLYDAVRERLAIVNADFQESLSGIREAQAFVHESLSSQRFRRLGMDYFEGRLAAQRAIATYFPFVQFLSAVADAIVLGVGAVLIRHGQLTSGVLIAFLLYVDMFFAPIQQLSQVFDSWQQTRVSVRRIADLMRLDTLTPEAPDAIQPDRVTALAIEDVHFAYPTQPLTATEQIRGPQDAAHPNPHARLRKPPEALRGLDLELEPGETLALVGETGAGKSTVVKLLARFYDPDSGSVTADRRDLRRLDLHGFRSQLGYVPQESFLFAGSIRDNIAYGRPDASDAEVEAAARAVGAHEVIAALPGGYLHQVTEQGRSLSSGQRQLVALARAELVDPAVLLLDEATANLDLATEHRVNAAMAAAASRRTTVVIAHRLQTASTADRIAVLAHGRVVELGPHQDLLAREGRYAAMWRAFDLVSSR